MRYALISDIHANYAALKTVLTDIADMRAEQIICLGDIAGYGPKPVEVLEAIYGVAHVTLLGNHDAAVCGKIDPKTFSPRAQEAVRRHREQISQAGMDWLKSLPLTFEGEGFRCAHGEFTNPNAFYYIIEPETALPSWKVTTEQLLFVGHSHLPGIYVIGASGIPHYVAPCDFELEDGKRYIVNPGTVGYPRAGECRSSYCLYDTDSRSITFRQLPFDRDGYLKALKEAGLGDDPWVKREDAQSGVPWLREHLSFAKQPPASDQHVQDLHELGSLKPRAVPRLPLVVLGLALGATAAIGGYALLGRHANGMTPLAFSVPSHDLPMLTAYPLTPPDKNLLPELPTMIAADGGLPGWRFSLDDRTRQGFGTGLRNGQITLKLHHSAACATRLESPLIRLAGTQLRSLRLSGRLLKSDAFAGTVFYQLVTYTTNAEGTPVRGSTFSFEMREKGKAQAGSLSRKIDFGKNVTHVRFQIESSFCGSLEIEQPVLSAETAKAAAAAKGKRK